MKQLLVLLFFVYSAGVSAQDVIVKKDGSTVVCRVVELTESEIVYKKWSNLNGSNYVMDRSTASAINYQNGKKVNLSEATNLYKPNHQNDGAQNLNDNALLKIYLAGNPQNKKKAKTIRTIGWIAGPVLIAGGAILLNTFLNQHSKKKLSKLETTELVSSFGLMALGVGTTITCLLVSNHLEKKDNDILSSNLYQLDFKFKDGTKLSAGVDMISNRTIGSNTLGLGLRYNF